jgi:hypothetical protein
VIAPPVFTSPGAAGGQALPASPLAGGQGGGPSDYTMLIRQSATPPPAAPKAAAPAPSQPAPARRSIPLGLLIALNVVLVLAIALVAYFVLRPAPPTAVPGGGVPAVPTSPAVQAPAVPKAPAVQTPAAPKLPAPPPANR